MRQNIQVHIHWDPEHFTAHSESIITSSHDSIWTLPKGKVSHVCVQSPSPSSSSSSFLQHDKDFVLNYLMGGGNHSIRSENHGQVQDNRQDVKHEQPHGGVQIHLPYTSPTQRQAIRTHLTVIRNIHHMVATGTYYSTYHDSSMAMFASTPLETMQFVLDHVSSVRQRIMVMASKQGETSHITARMMQYMHHMGISAAESWMETPWKQMKCYEAHMTYIALVMSMEPEILMLDDPFLDMPMETAERVHHGIKQFASNNASIVIVLTTASSTNPTACIESSSILEITVKSEKKRKSVEEETKLNGSKGMIQYPPKSGSKKKLNPIVEAMVWVQGISGMMTLAAAAASISASASESAAILTASSPQSATAALAAAATTSSTTAEIPFAMLRAYEAEPVIKLPLSAILIAGLLMSSINVVGYKLGLDLHSTILVAALRCIVQLTILGFVLMPIFKLSFMPLTIAYMAFMMLVAGQEAFSRLNYRYPHLFLHMMGAIATSCLVCVIFAVFVIIGVGLNPQYAIPIFGMLLGNSVSGMIVSLNTLLAELAEHKGNIETLICMGASRWEASVELLRRATSTGMTPSMNQMAVSGLVSIPGMMTGQILGGSPPATAARYQIVIAFLISTASSMSVLLTCVISLFSLINGKDIILDWKISKVKRGGSWIQVVWGWIKNKYNSSTSNHSQQNGGYEQFRNIDTR